MSVPSPDTIERPASPELQDDFTVAFVQMDGNLHDFARDEALRRYTEEMNRGGSFARRFIRNIWKGNIFREYYIQKRTSEAIDDIYAEQSLYLDSSEEEREAAIQATVSRFASEYEETIHRDAGETRSFLDQENTGSAQSMVEDVREVIRRYSRGDIDSDELAQERRALYQVWSEVPEAAEHLPRGEIFFSNIAEVAQNARAAVEHGSSVEDAVARVRVATGEARIGVRTEAEYNTIDRIVNRVNDSSVGSLVARPSVVASAVSIAASAAGRGSQYTAGALGMTLAPGVVGAGLAAAKENSRVKKERQQHAREMAQGSHIDDDAERRNEMEEARYETISANELSDSLRLALGNDENPRDDLDRAEAASVLGGLSEAVARNRLSDTENRDLISYTSPTQVEVERFELDLNIARARVSLRRSLEGANGNEIKSAFGLQNDEGYEAALDNCVEQVIERIRDDEDSKDTAFNSLKRKRIAKAAAKAGLLGAGIGVAVQESAALVSDSKVGLVESMVGASEDKPGQNETLLKGMFSDNSHETPGVELEGTSQHDLGNASDILIPEGTELVGKGDGRIELIDAEGNVIETLEVGENGRLTEETVASLSMKNIEVEHNPEVTSREVTTERKAGISDYLKLNDTQRVERGMWYDNNTPRNYDHNELRTHWGRASGGPAIDGKGNIYMNVASMTSNGSYHGGLSVDWQRMAANDRLKMFITASSENQNRGFFVPIGENGNIKISSDHPAAQLFRKGSDGSPRFHGGFIEVSQLTGQGPDGEQGINILSTVVGSSDIEEFTVADTEEVKDVAHHYNLITTTEPTIERDFVEMAPWIPIYGRKALEGTSERLLPVLGVVENSYYGNGSLEVARNWLRDHPDAHRPYHKIEQPDGNSRWVNTEGYEVVRDTNRERATINDYIESIRAEDPGYYDYLAEQLRKPTVKPMSARNRVSVNVPAWMEGSNIYNWLTEYSSQVDRDGQELSDDTYELNIIVNRKRGAEPDNTVSEIERFISDTQVAGNSVNVNYIDVEFDPPMNNVGFARKVITDLTLMRSLQRPRQEHPLYIESEDADVIRVDSRTVHNLIKELDQNPHLDAVRGIEDRMPKIMMQNDYLFLRRRLWDITVRLWQQKELWPENNPNWSYTYNRVMTSGWNTGYTAEGIALIGGYEPAAIGEDLLVGERLSMARGDGNTPNLEVLGRTMSRSDSSPRRFIVEVLTGRNAYSDDFLSDDINRKIRTSDPEELMEGIKHLSRIKPENQSEFSAMVSSSYRSMLQVAPSQEDAMQLYDRLMFFAGFKKSDYRYVNGNSEVEIVYWENIRQALEGYRQRNATDQDEDDN